MTDVAGTALVDGDGGFQDGFFKLCYQKEQTEPRAQPWKAHWSGEQQAVDGAQHFHYPSDKDGAALVDGAGSGPGLGDGDGYFFDLCC